MAQPTISTVTQTYQGTSIKCAKIEATDTASTYKFTNVAKVDGDYTFQIVMRATAAQTVSFTLGDETKTKNITTGFKRYSIPFPSTSVANSKDLLMTIPAGTYYVYNLQLEKGLHMSEWRPAPEDATDYADSAASGAVSGMTQEDVFKKLTNDGAVQGITLTNGELYINGAYIQSGTIVSTSLDSDTQTKITNGNTANSRDVACRGTCSTAATTAAKVVTCANFALATGSTVTVYFSTANTKADATLTLNVNNTGAKDIYVNGTATSSTNQLLWVAGSSITFTYNGTQWNLEDKPGSYYSTTACSTGAGVAAKTATVNGAVIFNGVSIKVPMTNANTNSSATLNISGLGAKNIQYSTTTERPTTANKHGWIAGRTVTFLFDGAYYRLMESSTIIDGGHIQTGTIDASVVSVTNLNASNITSGTISSATINIGSGVFQVSDTGKVTASNMNITGGGIDIITEASGTPWKIVLKNTYNSLQRTVSLLPSGIYVSTKAANSSVTYYAELDGGELSLYKNDSGQKKIADLNWNNGGQLTIYDTAGNKRVFLNYAGLTFYASNGTTVTKSYSAT